MVKGATTLLRQITADRTAGASVLALRALDVLGAVARNLPLRWTARDLRTFRAWCQKCQSAQPSMAAVANAATIARGTAVLLHRRGAADRGAVRRALALLGEEMERATMAAGAAAAKRLAGVGTVITLSRSSAVRAAFEASGARRPRAIVLEARPWREGVAMARDLARGGRSVEVVADGLGPAIVRECDAVLVGADTILADGGIVNKAGTYALALACRDAGVPLLVVAESIKFDTRHRTERPPPIRAMPPEELLARPPPSVRVRNRYFDVTPPRLITRLLTDAGDLRPLAARRALEPRLARWPQRLAESLS